MRGHISVSEFLASVGISGVLITVLVAVCIYVFSGCSTARQIASSATPFTIPQARTEELASEFNVEPCSDGYIRTLTCYGNDMGSVNCLAACVPSPFGE